MAESRLAEKPKLLHFSDAFPAKVQFGERLRLKIVDGINFGHGYCLLADVITVGREDTCDIILQDEKSSRKHVEISWKKDRYFARDLDSVNGLLINQKKVKGAFLDPGDVLQIGNTSIEVIASGKFSQLGNTAKSNITKSTLSEKEKKLKKSRTIVFATLFIIAMIALSSSEKVLTFREKAYISFVDQEKPEKKLTKKEGQEAIRDFVPKVDSDSPGFHQAQRFYREGMRELTNKNYRRAITAFETAQTIDPTHELSRVYIDIAKKSLEDDVNFNYRAAMGSVQAKRYREAKMYYNTVMRLLEKDPANTLYTDSKDAIDKIDKLESRRRK